MVLDFEECFRYFTENEPFEWQRNLFNRMLEGDLPTHIDIPTGCGKTKTMLIWLLALAKQAEEGSVRLPRRLVWIINRRAVVDQATREAEEIVGRLNGRPEVRDLLSSLSVSGEAVTVSTLRGEWADNEKWKEDPSRPAIIVGTVDMIGSKLLFRGYGDGHWRRPYHAGLLGVDALIVLDEVHLVPAFEKTLEDLREIHDSYPRLRPFHVMFLSATPRRGRTGRVLTWSQQDLKNEEFRRRVWARKTLRLFEAEDVRQKIIERAKEYIDKKARVAIFVYRPEDAAEIARVLREEVGEERVVLLTGQIRGHERDKLAEKETFKRFLLKSGRGAEVEQTCFFVATSAGEVGIDLDADFCICDLTTMDSLIQRWGRVNRSGRREDSQIELVYPKDYRETEDPLERARMETLKFLKELDGRDVSPASLAELRSRIGKEAFSPVPFSPELTETELELWSMTSVRESEFEPRDWYRVEYWLRGSEEEEPETFLLWRDDISYLSEYLMEDGEEREENIRDLLTSFYRPLSKEKLRVPTRQFKDFLRKAKKRLEKKGLLDLNAIVMSSGGRFTCKRIGDLAEGNLEFATVFLPSEVGGLNNEGYLDLKSIGEKAEDVADKVVPEGEERKRLLFEWGEEGCIVVRLGGEGGEREEGPESRTGLESYLREKYGGWSWRKFFTKKMGDEPVQCLVYLRRRTESLEDSKTRVPVPLQQHEQEVEELARSICEKLGLESEITEAVGLAARLHDEGKRNVHFQREMLGNDNPSPENLWAKSVGARNPVKSGFRHEIGSLLIAVLERNVNDDLVLHLIASSHGHSRPFFKEEAFKLADGEYVGFRRVTPQEVEIVKERCLRVFSDLQRKYGYWNLAYLESILKAADVMVSRREAEGT